MEVRGFSVPSADGAGGGAASLAKSNAGETNRKNARQRIMPGYGLVIEKS
jgi:hypothetical protein